MPRNVGSGSYRIICIQVALLLILREICVQYMLTKVHKEEVKAWKENIQNEFLQQEETDSPNLLKNKNWLLLSACIGDVCYWIKYYLGVSLVHYFKIKVWSGLLSYLVIVIIEWGCNLWWEHIGCSADAYVLVGHKHSLQWNESNSRLVAQVQQHEYEFK